MTVVVATCAAPGGTCIASLPVRCYLDDVRLLTCLAWVNSNYPVPQQLTMSYRPGEVTSVILVFVNSLQRSRHNLCSTFSGRENWNRTKIISHQNLTILLAVNRNIVTESHLTIWLICMRIAGSGIIIIAVQESFHFFMFTVLYTFDSIAGKKPMIIVLQGKLHISFG